MRFLAVNYIGLGQLHLGAPTSNCTMSKCRESLHPLRAGQLEPQTDFLVVYCLFSHQKWRYNNGRETTRRESGHTLAQQTMKLSRESFSVPIVLHLLTSSLGGHINFA